MKGEVCGLDVREEMDWGLWCVHRGLSELLAMSKERSIAMMKIHWATEANSFMCAGRQEGWR